MAKGSAMDPKETFMVMRCVVREVVGLCAQQSYKARHDVAEEADGKLQ
jgi:hypothetical protein